MSEAEEFNFKNCWTCHEHKEGAFIGHWWSDRPDSQPHVMCVKCITEAWKRNRENMQSNKCLVCTNNMMDEADFENFLKVISGKAKFSINEIIEYLDDEELGENDSQRIQNIIESQDRTNVALDLLRLRLESISERSSPRSSRDETIWMLAYVGLIGLFFLICVGGMVLGKIAKHMTLGPLDHETNIVPLNIFIPINMTKVLVFFQYVDI